MRLTVVILVIHALVLLIGCTTTVQRLDRLAEKAGFSRYVISGSPYRHLVYERAESGKRLFVFIDSDGTPWIDNQFIALDPTPKRPLAFEIMLRSDGSRAYVGRPCYFAISDPACKPEAWTNARYSEPVVASMETAITGLIAATDAGPVTLIGYSGGATLAMLLAPRVPPVDSVITVAGLLDTEAWVRHHEYEALSGSLNPANVNMPSRVRQVHLVGARDKVVPRSVNESAFNRSEQASVWSYSNFDHVCCWTQQWPEIFAKILQIL